MKYPGLTRGFCGSIFTLEFGAEHLEEDAGACELLGWRLLVVDVWGQTREAVEFPEFAEFLHCQMVGCRFLKATQFWIDMKLVVVGRTVLNF